MSTFAVTNSDELLPAVNYLLSNLDTSGGQGNVVIPGNVLVANTTTGVVSQSGNSTVFAYLYQYVNLRYSNNATGTAGFSASSDNFEYFGVFNSASSSPSNNPAAYQWYEVDPPFDSATSRTLYYSAIGGRQIQWAAASSPPSSGYQVTTANVAIDLDVVTTATGTPGDRGPIALCFVITTADPGTATSATLTGWFEASRDSLTAPIGTGLTPVVGDTATFTWAAGPGSPTETYSFNGSEWVEAEGQVVSGQVLVANSVPGSSLAVSTVTGDKISNSTISGNNIVTSTITGNLIADNTISGNNIVTSTITGNLIAGNTITGNLIAATTITANNIAANTITNQQIATNTITANNIAAGTITTQQIAANTITANNIAANTITANNIAANTITAAKIATNTITANNIAANTITTTQIATNTITATNIASNTITATNIATNTITATNIAANTITAAKIATGTLTTNLFTANTINGNIMSAGSITADKLAANAITANTVVSTGATIGDFNSVGFWLQGNTGNARFGNTVSIGNNASIGGNLTVAGLIASGNLNSNTVSTTTIVPASISSGVGNTSTSVTSQSSPTSGVIYFSPTTVSFATVEANQPVYIWTQNKLQVSTTPPGAVTVGLFSYLQRVNSSGVATTIFQFSDFQTLASGGTAANFNIIFGGFVDIVPTAGTYTYRIGFNWFGGGGSFSVQSFVFQTRTMLVQSLKR